MFKLTRKSRGAKVAAAAVAVGSLAAIGFAGNSPVNADPAQWKETLTGFGSDTTQDIVNAFQGQGSDGTFYTPLQTSNGYVLVSWDAFENLNTAGSECIDPQVGAPSIIRPNGSSNGHRIISASADPSIQYPITATTTCDGNQFVQNMADFARSSSGPGTTFTNTTGPLAWIPFGQDRLAFAYIRPNGTPVTDLTSTTITNAHASGVQLVDEDGAGPGTTLAPIIACGIQTGSGTYTTWMGNLGLVANTSGAGDNTGTGICNNAGGTGRLQENNGPELAAKAALLSSMVDPACDGVALGAAVPCTNAQLIVGFSASQFIARSNGVGVPAPALGVKGGLGAINGQYSIKVTADPNGIPGVTGVPVPPATSGTPLPIGLTGDETLAPNELTYGTAPFSRTVYNIVPVSSFTGITSKPEIVEMFVGSTSKICSSGSVIETFGFRQLATCGSTTTRGNYRSAANP